MTDEDLLLARLVGVYHDPDEDLSPFFSSKVAVMIFLLVVLLLGAMIPTMWWT